MFRKLILAMRDQNCYWCLRPIRYSPIANEWWHTDTGARECEHVQHLGHYVARPKHP